MRRIRMNCLLRSGEDVMVVCPKLLYHALLSYDWLAVSRFWFGWSLDAYTGYTGGIVYTGFGGSDWCTGLALEILQFLSALCHGFFCCLELALKFCNF